MYSEIQLDLSHDAISYLPEKAVRLRKRKSERFFFGGRNSCVFRRSPAVVVRTMSQRTLIEDTEYTDGKICLVTGATSGIGAAVALQIACLGATVIIVGRNAAKCLSLIRRIKRVTPTANVDFLVGDLSSQSQIRQLAADFAKRYSRLDILINDASAIFRKREISVDGLEMTFALNHLGYFLLTNLLLNRLRASKAGRIVVVSSAAHQQGRIHFEDLQSEHNYERLSAYSQSKLANLLFAYALARRLEGTSVSVNALHPGLVATAFGSNGSWLRMKLRNVVGRGMLSPADGARTVVYLATSPDVEGISGKYFYECHSIQSSPESSNIENGERLWQLSESLSGLFVNTICRQT